MWRRSKENSEELNCDMMTAAPFQNAHFEKDEDDCDDWYSSGKAILIRIFLQFFGKFLERQFTFSSFLSGGCRIFKYVHSR